ncbi:MAG: pyruvate formate-lyase-activating protein [Patescibacteria group bacterium]|nr:pyruvate formate lyase-activating protein [Patescibacteria group bacterium]
MTKGRIHSFESFGTLDGPGLRFVVFLEGCPLRCLYCHNVDMLDMKGYQEMTPNQLLQTILPYKPYFESSNGGVTLSGGDPILQPDFTAEFFRLCKKEKIHTTIDTSCFTTKKNLDKLIPVTDLWMISLKHFNEKTHLELTGVTNKPILENIRYLKEKKAKIRLRYLIIPGWTDTSSNLRALKKFAKEIRPQEVELLTYHTHGIYKWKELGKKYKLGRVKPPSIKSCLKIKEMLEKEGLKVMLNE